MSNGSLKQYNGFPLITIRFTPPALTEGEVARERLLKKMMPAQRESVFVVTAPAGYGKSSLLSQCYKIYQDKGWHTAWLTLEGDDNYGGRFSFCLDALVKKLSDDQLSASSCSNEESAQSCGRELVSMLINLVGHSDEKYAIFLDDYHVIEEGEIHDVIHYLLKHLPANLRVFIGSRTSLPFPMAKFKAGNKLSVFDASDLCFDKDEAGFLLRESNRLDMKEEDFNRLYDQTGGWAAVLQLAAISVKGVDDQSSFVKSFSGAHESVSDFLAEEVVSLMPEEIANYLIRSSIAERFCAPLCDAINGMSNSGIRLEQHDQVRFFIQSLGEGASWFQLHPLFRNFLLRELERRFSHELSDLHRRASLWFEEKGMIGGAAGHAISGGDEARAMELLEEQGLRLLQKGFLPLMFSLVGRLPGNLIQKSHHLLLQLIWLEVLGLRFLQAQRSLEQLKTLLESETNVKDSTWPSFYGVKAFLYCLDEHFKEMNEIVEKWFPAVSDQATYVMTTFKVVKVFGYLSEFDFDSAKNEISYMRGLPETAEFVMSQAYASSQRALVHYSEGELQQAALLLKADIENMQGRVGPDSGAVHMMAALLGAVCTLSGNQAPEPEQIKLESDEWGMLATVEMLLVIIPARVRQLVAAGQSHSALNYLVEQQGKVDSRKWSRLDACIVHERVKLAIDSGDLKKASLIFSKRPSDYKTATSLSACQVEQVEEWLSVAEARLALGEGEGVKAAVIIKALIEQCARQGRLLRQMELWIFLGRVYSEKGDIALAKEALTEALLLDQESCVIQPFRDEGKEVLKALQSLSHDLANETTDEKKVIRLKQVQKILTPVVSDVSPMNAPDKKRAAGDVSPYSEMVESLTKRELATLKLLAEGLTNKEISTRLSISTSTVKTHLHYAYGKLGVSRRTQAVRRLKELGVFG